MNQIRIENIVRFCCVIYIISQAIQLQFIRNELFAAHNKITECVDFRSFIHLSAENSFWMSFS